MLEQIMSGRVLIFTGAPDNDSIDWGTADLLSHFNPQISDFLQLPQHQDVSVTPSRRYQSSLQHAVWRYLSLKRSHVPTGFSQQHGMQLVENYPSSADFLNTTTVSFETSFGSEQSSQASGGLLSQFYEHSLAVYDEIPSSQLVASSSEGDSSFISEDSSSRYSDENSTSFIRPPLGNHGGEHLSDLEDIPNAAYLRGIEPATMTVNLIVGIISIAAPRTVKTRWGSTKTLVEVLVGDETKSGFSVTFWLPSESVAQSALAGLRAQDVVLMQNVALNVFTKKVYGHSLRKDMTKVNLLYRKKLDPEDVGGYYSTADLSSRSAHPQLKKTQKVREWVLQFVGDTGVSKGKACRVQTWDQPPDDTQ